MMLPRPRVILLEFNELCPRLIHRYIAENRLPNFKRFFSESFAYTTRAAERAPNVDPWVQWPTVHTGLNLDGHGIERLNEGHKFEGKRLWDLLSDAGYRVWVCGSMSVNYRRPINGRVLPDPWTTHVAPSHGDLSSFFGYIQRNVQEYTNARAPLTVADSARFAWFLATHGLSAETIRAVVQQLRAERHDNVRWRRAAVLDRIQYDVFRHFFLKERPDFATLFLNSTAHYQHFYWRNLEPELFTVRPSKEEQRRLGSAIQYGYEQMDHLLGRLFSLAGTSVSLVLATAISQEPYLAFEERGGKSLYRPSNFASIFEFAGISDYRVAPVMAHQFHVYHTSECEAVDGERRLLGLTIDGQPAMRVSRNGAQLFSECSIYRTLPKTVRLRSIDGNERPFFDLFYQVEGMRSGMHNPDGVLWIRTPARRHALHDGIVPLSTVAPTILEMFGVPRPTTMPSEPLGLSWPQVGSNAPVEQAACA